MRSGMDRAGFVVIAAALHVAAFAAVVPDGAPRGPLADAPPARLAAGGAETQAMVAAWEAPPEIETALPAAAEPPAEPPVAAVPPALPDSPADAAPRSDAAPTLSAPRSGAVPNLPPAPEAPAPQVSALALGRSARPAERPARPAPRRAAEPAPESAPAPAPAAQPPRQARSQPEPQPDAAPQRAGQGGQAAGGRGGGGGGASAAQVASAQQRWAGQIQSCIARRAQRPRGVRGSGATTISIRVGRDGQVLGVGVSRSSGDPALDQAAVQAAQRARRCPAAPAELTDASYAFAMPVTLN